MAQIDSLKALILDLPPSCIEFWPVDPQYAVVGTYNLEKTAAELEAAQAEEAGQKRNQQRNGSLILIQVQDEDVKIIQAIPTPSAIFDLHFAPAHQPRSIFAVATSTGSIDLYQLTDSSGQPLYTLSPTNTTPKITHVRTIQYFPEDHLITAFSWHPKKPLVSMTLSSGEVHLGRISTEDLSTATICTHDLEAWTLSFINPDGLGVYTGGDDSALNYRPLPEHIESLFNEDIEQVPAEDAGVPWTDKKIHGAGVTAILPLQIRDIDNATLVITGSYDDHIRLLDVSMGRRRSVLAEMNLEGGVWRLKRLNAEGEEDVLLLASCMHAGSRILRLAKNEESEWSFEVLAKFEEHKSMNYGSDCQPRLTESGQRTLVSTSFYDRLLCLWRY